MKEELEKKFYMSHAPKYKQANDNIKAEFIGEFIRFITLGIVPPSTTIRAFYKSCYHKYATKNPNSTPQQPSP
jgi:hypothetical protein